MEMRSLCYFVYLFQAMPDCFNLVMQTSIINSSSFFQASEKEILIVLWCCIVMNAFIATGMAIKYQSVYNLL